MVRKLVKINQIQVMYLMGLGFSLSATQLQGAAEASDQPLTIAQRKALLAQKQAQDAGSAKPAPQSRRPVTKPVPSAESKSPETVPAATAPTPDSAAVTTAPAPTTASPAPATGVKARAAALAAKVSATSGVPTPGQKLATCEGAGCTQRAYESLGGTELIATQKAAKKSAHSEIGATGTISDEAAAKPAESTQAALAIAAAAASRAKHGGAVAPAIPDLTAEQLAGKTTGQRAAEQLAAEELAKAEAKKLAEIAAAEALRLEQERAARLAAEEALRVEQARLAAAQEEIRLAELAAQAPEKFDFNKHSFADAPFPPLTEEYLAELTAQAARKKAAVPAETGWLASLRQRAGGWLG